MNARGAVVALLLAACAPAVATPSVAPSSSPLATSSQNTAPPRSSPNVSVTRVATIPTEFLYVETSPSVSTKLWLVDPSGRAAPTAVATWTLGGHTSSVSRDGRSIVIETRGTRSIVGLALVHPLTGEASVLYEGSADARAIYAQISPDGRSVAFALGLSRGWDGVWLVDTASGATRKLLAQPLPNDPSTGPVTVIGWSDDSQWVTYVTDDPTDLGAGAKVFVHNIADGRRVALGPGSLASWQSSEPRLVFAHVGGRGNQGAFGATISTFDLTRGTSTALLEIAPRVEELAWSPRTGRFLYLASELGCPFHSTIWTSAPGATAWQMGRRSDADAAWWGADGTTVYALVRGDGASADLIDALTGQTVARIPDAVPPDGCAALAPSPAPAAFATVCGTISDWMPDGPLTDGSFVLNAPGRAPIRLTIPAGRLGGNAAGYVCVGVVAGRPYPLFDGFATANTPLFVEQGRVPASTASPSPLGFVLPQACAFVASPIVGTEQTDWSVECGAANDRDARGFLGAALAQQGWTQCGLGLAAATWRKGSVMLGVAESSLAPGDYPRVTQFAHVISPCG